MPDMENETPPAEMAWQQRAEQAERSATSISAC